MCARLLNSPKRLRSHKTTAMTTMPLKMDLVFACIGIKRSSARQPRYTRSPCSEHRRKYERCPADRHLEHESAKCEQRNAS